MDTELQSLMWSQRMKSKRIKKSVELIKESEIQNSWQLKSLEINVSIAGERKIDSTSVLSNLYPFTIKLKDSLPIVCSIWLNSYWKNEKRQCSCRNALSVSLCCSTIQIDRSWHVIWHEIDFWPFKMIVQGSWYPQVRRTISRNADESDTIETNSRLEQIFNPNSSQSFDQDQTSKDTLIHAFANISRWDHCRNF
jgi:hypothetical protein